MNRGPEDPRYGLSCIVLAAAILAAALPQAHAG